MTKESDRIAILTAAIILGVIFIGISYSSNLIENALGAGFLALGTIFLVLGPLALKYPFVAKVLTELLKQLSNMFEEKDETEKTTQKVDRSSEVVQQKSNRDSIVVQNFHSKPNSFESDKTKAIRKMHKEMLYVREYFNMAATDGIRDESQLRTLHATMRHFIGLKQGLELDLNDDTLHKKLNAVMAAFRYTFNELADKFNAGDLKQGLKGTKAFEFISACQAVIDEMKLHIK